MGRFANVADRDAVQAEMPWAERRLPTTMYDFLTATRDRHGARSAISFQILSDPGSKAETLSWNDLHRRVTQAANLFLAEQVRLKVIAQVARVGMVR